MKAKLQVLSRLVQKFSEKSWTILQKSRTVGSIPDSADSEYDYNGLRNVG
jgi:hypothetical protein